MVAGYAALGLLRIEDHAAQTIVEDVIAAKSYMLEYPDKYPLQPSESTITPALSTTKPVPYTPDLAVMATHSVIRQGSI